MSELDSLELLSQLDRHERLARAAAWAARRTAVRRALPIERQQDGSIWVGLLPPELVPLGHLAAGLIAEETNQCLWVYPSPVRLGSHPGAHLARIDTARLRELGTHPPDTVLAEIAQAASSHDLTQTLHADRHLTDILLDMVALFIDVSTVFPLSAALDRALAGLDPSIPTAENPAKQLAQQLHERVPVFWGNGPAVRIADLWAMRQQWYAERAAMATTTADLARLGVLARLPRYWPNTAVFVQIVATHSDADLPAAVTHILTRRRFPTKTVTPPSHLSVRDWVIYLLELGEWVALYAALLNQSDLGARAAHTILFD